MQCVCYVYSRRIICIACQSVSLQFTALAHIQCLQWAPAYLAFCGGLNENITGKVSLIECFRTNGRQPRLVLTNQCMHVYTCVTLHNTNRVCCTLTNSTLKCDTVQCFLLHTINTNLSPVTSFSYLNSL